MTLLLRKKSKNQNLVFAASLATALVASTLLAFGLYGGTDSVDSDDLHKKSDDAAVVSPTSKRFHQRIEGTPIFHIRPFYAKKDRFAFAYETLPSGAVRFFDGTDHREYCMSQPFQIREGFITPTQAVPEQDWSRQEKNLDEAEKYYLVSSYMGVREMRYSTFKYAIDGNGTLLFEANRNRYALTPPYIIEEKLLAKGNKPTVTDYPSSPDRGR